MLPNGVRFHINDALYFSKSIRNLLSFKDIHKNGYHIETMNVGDKESLYITFITYGKKIVAEKLPSFSSGLYHMIKPFESMCNTPKYTLVVFNMFRVFCRHKLKFL